MFDTSISMMTVLFAIGVRGSIDTTGFDARWRSGQVKIVTVAASRLFVSDSSAMEPPARGSEPVEGSATADTVREPSRVPGGVHGRTNATLLSAGTFRGPACPMKRPDVL